jgi:hypothetical protein
VTHILGQEKPSIDEVLSHHGVKGMKWGVRKDRLAGGEPSTSNEVVPGHLTDHQKEVAKKVAIGVGVLAAIAGAGYVAYKLDQSGVINISELRKTKEIADGAKKASQILKEPTEIAHASRGHSKGFTFIKKGGLDDPLHVYEQAFGNESRNSEMFRHFDGKIAVRFLDPEGRRDFSGRPIPHEMIIPRSMTEGIHSLDDVRAKIWPQLKDSYSDFYDASVRKTST